MGVEVPRYLLRELVVNKVVMFPDLAELEASLEHVHYTTVWKVLACISCPELTALFSFRNCCPWLLKKYIFYYHKEYLSVVENLENSVKKRSRK